MRWIAANSGSIGMAFFLALLTWIYLWSESTDSREIKFPFTPAVRAQRIATIDYEIDKRPLVPGESVGIRLTGPRADVSAVERSVRTCSPSFEEDLFKEESGTFAYELRPEDIRLPKPVLFQGKVPTITGRYRKATAPRPETRIFGGVPVRIVGPDEIVRHLRLDGPPVIDVSATGPVEVLERLTSSDFLAFVEVDSKIGELKAGEKMILRGIQAVMRRPSDKPVDIDPMPGVKSASRLVDVTVLP